MRSCSRSLAGVCATVRLGFGAATVGAGVSSFRRFPQEESVSAAHNNAGAAKRRQPVFPSRRSARCVKSAGPTIRPGSSIHPFFAPDPNENRCPVFGSRAVPPAPQFAPPEAAHSWSSPRRDNAADTNPSIFERLRSKVGVLERRYDAP